MDVEARKSTEARVRAIAEPVAIRLGCEVVAVELTNIDGGLVLRLYVDRPGGITLDECTRISRGVSPELDVEEPIAASYRLEVSSPGIRRPLERESDFVRFSGFRAKVRLIPGTGRRRYTGVLCGVENKLIQIQVDNDLHELPIDKIDRAFLDLTLDEYQALGRQISSQIENSQTELQNDQ